MPKEICKNVYPHFKYQIQKLLNFKHFNYMSLHIFKTSNIFPMFQAIYPLSTETIITHRDKNEGDHLFKYSFTHALLNQAAPALWHMEKLFSH